MTLYICDGQPCEIISRQNSGYFGFYSKAIALDGTIIAGPDDMFVRLPDNVIPFPLRGIPPSAQTPGGCSPHLQSPGTPLNERNV